MPNNEKNFYNLIKFVIEECSKTDLGNSALFAQGLSDTAIVKGGFQRTNAAGDVLSCGLTGNAFCFLFTGARQPIVDFDTTTGGQITIDTLQERVKDLCPRLIRLSSPNHSYVIEQIDTRHTKDGPILGNVYQSNMGVIGEHDEYPTKFVLTTGMTTKAYLDAQPGGFKLDTYLAALAKVINKGGTAEERFAIYKSAYILDSFGDKAKVTLRAFQTAEDAGKFKFRFKHQIFSAAQVLKNVKAFLASFDPSHDGALSAEADRIYAALPLGGA